MPPTSQRPDPALASSTTPAGLLAEVSALVARLEDGAFDTADGADTQVARVLGRLRASVLRPLQQTAGTHQQAVVPAVATRRSGESGAGSVGQVAPGQGLHAAIWDLAVEATKLAQRKDCPAATGEAVAALQDLACGGVVGGEGFDSARSAALRALWAAHDPEIVTLPNGPYLASNIEVIDWLGVPVETPPTVALCRCGASAIQPLCDGSHATSGFADAKDAKRVPDTLDLYEGKDVVVSDNRGTCAHSGFCSDRVPTAFRTAKEPFVAASGARMDELVRAVRACPSGALGLRLFGESLTNPADQQREPVVEISRDGPYRVRGGIQLNDADGNPVVRNKGASQEHYSLCRCGHSLNKPFCSGMHWYVDFHDPVMPDAPTIFEWAGGLPALTRLTRLFFEKHVPDDPLLAPLFAQMSPDLPDRLAAWMGEVFGGPKLYSERFGDHPHMLSRHAGSGITEEQRARWVAIFIRCADESGLPSDAEFRSAFTGYLDWGSRVVLATSTEG